MPRSASRDRSDPFVGRRAYFRRATGLAWGKGFLSVVACLCAAGWAVYDATAVPANPIAHTHGPLADPHAAWDNDCAACHRSFGAGDFGSDPLAAFDARSRWQSFSCEKCHAGPKHQANMNATAAEWHERCNNCHRDHTGRMNNLKRLPDSNCVHCHAELRKFASGESKTTPAITNFAKNHPVFQSLTAFDPAVDRKLKFSHSLHATAGIVYAANSKGPKKLSDLPPEDQDRYRKYANADSGILTLDCKSCHQLDSEIAGKGAAPSDKSPRAEGANYLPVRFEQHCQSCHPLVTRVMASERELIPHFSVPHRMKLNDRDEFIRGQIARELTNLDRIPSRSHTAGPGGRTDDTPDRASTSKSFRDEVQRLTEIAGRDLFREPPSTPGTADLVQGCFKCHVSTGKPDRSISPIPNKTVWLTKAKFNHASHRSADCTLCHKMPDAKFDEEGQRWYEERESVLIEGLDNCKMCHSPAKTRVANPDGSIVSAGGVRHGCTDCHSYHNGDHPLQGRGAIARDPQVPKGWDQLMPRK